MSSTSPPPEAQRFGRSQTPESPRPLHIPEPANIPVLLNQMDPVFNDTATYNIPNNENFSPFPDPTSEQAAQNTGVDEHDAVQNFFREAEHQAAAEPEPSVNTIQNTLHANPNTSTEANSFPTLPLSEHSTGEVDQKPSIGASQPDTFAVSGADISESTAAKTDEPRSEGQDYETLSTTEPVPDPKPNSIQQQPVPNHESDGGVDYQSLLETISQSASAAPPANALTVPTTTASQAEEAGRALHSVPGLPRKPPPQEHPVEFPSYSSYDTAQSQNQIHNVPANGANADTTQMAIEGKQAEVPDQVSLQSAATQLYPSLPTFSPYTQLLATPADQFPINQDQLAPGQDANRSKDPLERPWSPKTQSLYDKFLEDERRYVTEGIWDKFPLGSRLFVGNLPSEKVTKRDLFHKFHKHGQLAQISIKQAYGFVQFLEAASCSAALSAEQGIEIRGRKVHLEISKPQKNTRNAGTSGSGNKNQQQRRRSRSPDRGGRRDNRNYSDFRDEPARRRDDFRNRRSPSPRAYRQRDDYRPGDRDGRSRSPVYGNKFASPSATAPDDEETLQLPRREARHVPDVQLLVLETDIVQSFINWVEQGFRSRGLQASTIWVNNRLPLPAVIKRQIIEGVQAVVKLTRAAQNNSKIPLQVFDRSAGASNVNFSEYVDLDVSIAADVVLQARQRERSGHTAQNFHPPVFPPQNYQPQMAYTAPQPPIQYPQQTPPQYPAPLHVQPPQYFHPSMQQSGHRPPAQLPTPTNQPPNLQQLLANLRQPPTPTAAQNGQVANLSGILGNMNGPQQYQQGQPAMYGQYHPGPQQQGGQQPNVQNIMEQLARYQR